MPDVVALFQRLRQWLDLILDRLRGEGAQTDLVVGIVGGIAATTIVGLASPLLKAGGQRLARFLRRKPIVAEELEYLRLLARKLQTVGHQWTPMHSVLPSVPLAGRTARRSWRQRWRVRTGGLRARLFRHDSNDYSHNPMLADLELSLRAGFGRRVKIGNLAAELRRFTKIVVLGDPGSGKSVCLRQAAHDIAVRGSTASRPPLIPIMVDMGQYDGWDSDGVREPLPVLRFLRQQLCAEPSIKEAPTKHPSLYVSEHLEELLLQGRVIALFDALDEMPQDSYSERYRTLRKFMIHWEDKGNRFIYSCRALDYDPSFRVDEILIDPFDRHRVEQFLYQHAPSVAESLYRRVLDDPTLEEMVSNPFHLQALAFLNVSASASATPATLDVPSTRGALIRKFVAKLLAREAATKQDEALAGVGGSGRLHEFLQQLAFELQSKTKGGTSVRTDDLSELLGQHPDAAELLSIAMRARIIGKRGQMELPAPIATGDDALPGGVLPAVPALPARIDFVHHRLEEFFAAEELALRLARGASIEAYIEDIWWQETVILAVTVTDNPRALLERMLARRSDMQHLVEWVKEIPGASARAVRRNGALEPAAQDEKDEPALLDTPMAVVSRRIAALLVGPLWSAEGPSLKSRGEVFARRRALFVAAEALGQLPPEGLVDLRREVQSNLDLLVHSGNSLQQVRALRALRFIPSEDVVATIDRALQSPSSWVRLTALRVAMRLDLEGQRARALVWRMTVAIFRQWLRARWVIAAVREFMALQRERGAGGSRRARAEPGWPSPPTVLCGLVPALWKERGGRSLALTTLMLIVVAGAWSVVVVVLWVLLCVITAGVVLLTSAVWDRWWSRGDLRWKAISAHLALDVACIVAVAACLPRSESRVLVVLAPFFASMVIALAVDGSTERTQASEPKETARGRGVHERKETCRILLRGGVLAVGAFLTTSDRASLVLGALATTQVLWAGVRGRAVFRRLRAALMELWRVAASAAREGPAMGLAVVAFVGFVVVILAVMPQAMACLLVFYLLHALRRMVRFGVVVGRAELIDRGRRESVNLSEYVVSQLEVIRDRSAHELIRVRAALRVLRSPIADLSVVDRLQALAESHEDLPFAVRDALFQAIDAADTRIRRGQVVSVEAGWIDQDEGSRGTPGEQSRPYLDGLLASLGFVAMAGAVYVGRRLPERTSDAWIVAGGMSAAALALVVVAASGWALSRLRAAAMTLGTGLLLLCAVRASLVWLHGHTVPFFVPQVLRTVFFDLSATASCWGGILAAGLGAILAMGLHLLGSDEDVTESPITDAGLRIGALVLGLICVGTSPPALDLAHQYWAPLPRIELIDAATLRISALPRDGRMLRAAVVELAPTAALPSLNATFPEARTRGYERDAGTEKPLDAILGTESPVKGEAWLYAGAEPDVWQNLPNGCLAIDSTKGDSVVFRIETTCRGSGGHRLVLILYSAARSERVRAQARFDRGNLAEVVSRDDGRLLVDTLSAFVRHVWSPPF